MDRTATHVANIRTYTLLICFIVAFKLSTYNVPCIVCNQGKPSPPQP